MKHICKTPAASVWSRSHAHVREGSQARTLRRAKLSQTILPVCVKSERVTKPCAVETCHKPLPCCSAWVCFVTGRDALCVPVGRDAAQCDVLPVKKEGCHACERQCVRVCVCVCVCEHAHIAPHTSVSNSCQRVKETKQTTGLQNYCLHIYSVLHSTRLVSPLRLREALVTLAVRKAT